METNAVVQQYAGTSLKDFLASPDYQNLSSAQKLQLQDQLGQAIAIRQVMGDFDFNNGNFAVSMTADGNIKVTNIDMSGAFPNALFQAPNWGIGGVSADSSFGQVAGQPLGTAARNSLENFVTAAKTDQGRLQLQQAGLNPTQIGSMVFRANLLLNSGFPTLSGAMPQTAAGSSRSSPAAALPQQR